MTALTIFPLTYATERGQINSTFSRGAPAVREQTETAEAEEEAERTKATEATYNELSNIMTMKTIVMPMMQSFLWFLRRL